MAGTLTISTLSDGTNSTSSTNCIQGSAKAWVRFNGTTSPGTIAGSFNVSSVTRSGTGAYTINFTTALTDANYNFVGSTEQISGYGMCGVMGTLSGTQTASALAISTAVNDGSSQNPARVCISVFR